MKVRGHLRDLGVQDSNIEEEEEGKEEEEEEEKKKKKKKNQKKKEVSLLTELSSLTVMSSGELR